MKPLILTSRRTRTAANLAARLPSILGYQFRAGEVPGFDVAPIIAQELAHRWSVLREMLYDRASHGLTPRAASPSNGTMDFADLLHAHGLKATPARIALLQVLAEEPHLSAEDLERRLEDRQVKVTAQALYNAVNEMTELKILRRFSLNTASASYEIETGDNHHHAVCSLCGRVENVACAHGQAPCFHPGTTSDFSIQVADVLFYGQCKDGCLPSKGTVVVR